ncbi:MAG: ribbon-helix-helix protein, CopG family [Chloroflexi bacterium]|nr:ribbon-helix-helix protein, CopG family [Chloroflexota bacterium]MYB84582.1 ribbon-helix-helix protein, CopG family [Chloroflexota bacterium]
MNPKTKTLQVRIDSSEYHALWMRAYKSHRSVSDFVRVMLREAGVLTPPPYEERTQ